MTEHLSLDDLLRIVDGAADRADHPHADLHLERCSACREDLLLVQRFQHALSMSSEEPDRSRGTEGIIRAFNERIQEEDRAARELVAPLLAADNGGYALGIGRRGARFRTGGVVRVLCSASHAALNENALKALVLADEAIEIARALPDDLYPHKHVEILRGNAWKARANALRFEGNYRSAHDALDQAERAYRQLGTPDFYVAACDYVRATVYARMRDFANATRFARKSAEQFQEFQQLDRYRHARSIEGGALFDSGAFEPARVIFEEIASATRQVGDRFSLAYALLALGAANVELHAYESATDQLREAIGICRELDLHTERIRGEWILARIPLRTGSAKEATEALRGPLGEAHERGLIGMEAEIALDLAEAYLALARPYDVRRLCVALIDSFTSRGELTGAMTAFAFLRDAATLGTARGEHVKHVREFLERQRSEPQLLFAPPQTP